MTCKAAITDTINPGPCQQLRQQLRQHGKPYCYYHGKMYNGHLRPLEGTVRLGVKTVVAPERKGRPGWYYEEDDRG